jgi:hypothetical protein
MGSIMTRGQSNLGALLAAACLAGCAVAPPQQVPSELAVVAVAPVAGPRYVGNAFAVSGDEWLTCRHVVPADADCYEVAGTEFRQQPLCVGTEGERDEGWAAQAAGDWSLLRGVPCPGTPLPLDFARPLAAESHVWIVGWLPGDDAATGYRRHDVRASVGDRRADSEVWFLDGMQMVDGHGLSGSPVILVEAGVAVVVGIYCGTLDNTTSVLGVPMGRTRRNVFLRPKDLMARR